MLLECWAGPWALRSISAIESCRFEDSRCDHRWIFGMSRGRERIAGAECDSQIQIAWLPILSYCARIREFVMLSAAKHLLLIVKAGPFVRMRSRVAHPHSDDNPFG